MRLYIYCIVGVCLIYNIGCNSKPVKQHSEVIDSSKFVTHVEAQPEVKAGDDVVDYDGNRYHTVIIGKQTWMAENLKVTHYNNGDKIPQVTNDKQWRELKTGAYCIYDNQAANVEIYGMLYNWHSVTDTRRLAPKGWHIPTQEEWETMIKFLGGNTTAGSKLTTTGAQYWEAPNNTATNQSEFGALPAGDRNNNGTYSNKGFSSTWWSSTGEAQADFATNYSIISNSMAITADVDDRVSGLSIRCVKD